jgi:hypothetical protein
MAGKGVEPYPSDVTDEGRAFVLPYLLLCREDSRQSNNDLRTVFNAVRYVAQKGDHLAENWTSIIAQLRVFALDTVR